MSGTDTEHDPSEISDAAGFDRFLYDLAAAPAVEPPLPKLRVGTVVADTYRVEAELGAGGMGVVVRATDLRLRRQVALKVHTRRRGQPGLELLRVEARALAHLTHPNVVEVFEIGTHEGRLFIAMEFVDGGTLGAWQVDRPWREVIEMYLEAGEGLAAAHRAGLVHRDFKPANVLVGRDGRPRVADFGLVLDDASLRRVQSLLETGPAAAADPIHADSAPFEGLSARAQVGTPRYMAPEQAAGHGVDHRADQYALCSALFEALTGDVPMDDMVEFPTRPGVPTEVWRVLRKGLASKPEQRHETLTDLLEALRRAMRPRNRGLVATIVGVGGSASLGLWFVGVPATPLQQCRHETRARVASWEGPRARMESALDDRARVDAFSAQLDAYADQWSSMRQEACEMDRGDRRHDAALRCLDRSARAIEDIVAVVSASPPAPSDPIRPLPLPPLDPCSLERATESSPSPVDPDEASALDDVLADIEKTNMLIWNGELDAAREVARSTLHRANNLRHRATLVAALLNAGDAALESGHLESSHAYYEQGFYLAQGLGLDHDAAQAGASLIEILQDLGDLRAADRWAKHATSSFDRLEAGSDPAGEISLLSSIGNLRREQGRYDEALEIQQRILAILPTDGDEVRRSKSHNSLGATLYAMGRTELAIEHLETALELNDAARGPNHPDNVYPLANLAWILIEAEELDRAEPLLDRAIRLLKETTADDAYALATLLSHRGALLDERGEHEVALLAYGEGLEVVKSQLDEDHELAGMLLNNQAASFEALGRLGQARDAYERAIRVLEQGGNPQDEILVLARDNLARLTERASERPASTP